MSDIYEVSGLGPTGIEDLFFVNNDETSVEYDLKETKTNQCHVPEKLMFDEDPSDILMEVFGQYTEESILKDALEELETSQNQKKSDQEFNTSHYHINSEEGETPQDLGKSEEHSNHTQENESFTDLECLNDLEQFLGISGTKDEKREADKPDSLFQFDDVFESLVFNDGLSNDLENDLQSDIKCSSTDPIDTSCIYSDTTEVVTSSDLLAKLMSKSGILTGEKVSSPQSACANRKRIASPDSFGVPPEKVQKYSETDADECCSIYSSCASSPDDRFAVRRQRNNEASKVSRANRKAKHQRLFEKEKELEKDNDRLRKLIENMTTETEALRKILVEKLSGAKSPVD